MAVAKDPQMLNLETIPTVILAPVQSVMEIGADSNVIQHYGGDGYGELAKGELVKTVGSLPAIVSGRGRGGIDPRPWQQEGDWPCPNSSCSNINFSFRGICNRCGTARPTGFFPPVRGGLGCSRIRGRGPGDAGCRSGRGAAVAPALFGPNDWNCPMCGNINWAKRTKCNICNTTKPGYNEGGAREGRAGGYKEFDEAEIEESKRRRREMEEDDGEMYDEFGNLKKKFRAKSRTGGLQGAAGLDTGGIGKAGWNMVEFGVAEQSKQKSKDRSCFRYDNETADHQGRDSVQNVPTAPRSQRVNVIGRETRLDVDEWNREGNQDDHPVMDQDSEPGGAWALERIAVRGRDEEVCILESENDLHGKYLCRRKRLRERDRIMD
ncbi:hypothetical protein KC19_VG235300 [Ceratodon purpureus]|uniref:RanBP2-type domain-containing protein n=1 Tax=Ceratodon purpureus TaxID=3225 RepID=A0A8T0HTL9_CERPU|nr:hypothetical protein KC19_VG235300 [Ceratodon purpureus]